ncbi:MAG: SDR family oxidoreductase [Pseudohongiella sp.]|uniref:SDR family NAD(P)-dependent oxidoreductase n=1 Tax=Pseudohongiella sp. TaxID=1979412 RepID=UPI0034A079F8
MSVQKVALVTGAATGIGRASAVALAAAGFTIAANYRSKKNETLALLKELDGDGHQAFCADVANAQDAARLVDEVLGVYQRLDVLVNAAGQFTPQDVKSEDFAAWQSAWQYSLELNLLAPLNLAFLAAKPMIKQGAGKIINITSRGAFRGEPTAPAYGASKSGLNSATQSLALALGGHGICVYAIAPGWTETPAASPRIRNQGWDDVAAQSPLGRIGRPSEIGHLVAFLAGNETEYLTGAIIDANGASYLRN